MSALHTPTNEGQALKRVRKIGSAEKRTAGHSFAASAGSALPPEIAKELGITDRGVDRPSYRDMLGSPRDKNPAAVY